MEELIAVLAPLVATIIVAVHRWLQARLTPDRLAAVSQLARVAVDAAEEIGNAADGVSPGEKFAYAETFLRQSARRVGIKLTNEEANAFIHAVLAGKRDAIEDAVDAALQQMFASVTAQELATEDE